MKAKKIPAAKASRIAVGKNHYRLEPAVSRTHYGEHRLLGGGQPYAFAAKRADDAWLVASDWDGKKHGLVQQWSDGEWTFSKIDSQAQAPSWLRAQYRDTPATIYNLSSRLWGGSTPEEAISHGLGLGVRSPSHATRKPSSGSWNTVATVDSDWVADAGSAASDLADAIERKFGVERMIEGSWPKYRVLAKGDEKMLEKARVFAGQWLNDYEQRAAQRIKTSKGAGHATKKTGSGGVVNYHLDEIDAWRSGQRATPGLSASGDRYVGRMLDAIKQHELALIALGHKPTIEYVRAHGFADGQRGRL